MDLNSLTGILGKDKDTKNFIIIAAVVLGFYALRKMPGLNLGALTGLGKTEALEDDRKGRSSSRHRRHSSRNEY